MNSRSLNPAPSAGLVRFRVWAILVLTLSSAACNKTFVLKEKFTRNAVGQNWTLFGGDSARLNYRDRALRPPLRLKWTYKATSAVGSSLVVANGVAYVPTLDGRLDVVSIATGERLGRVKLRDNLEATCTYFEDQLYIAYRYGEATLAKYDLITGKTEWEVDAGDIASEPLATDEGIYVAALYRHIDKYDPATGEKLWSYESKDQHRSSPALSHNTLVVGCDNGTIYALSPKSGKLRWKAETGASVFATPVIDNETVFVGSLDSVFYALNLHDGSLLWSFRAEAPLFQAAGTDGVHVVFGATDGHFYCMNNKTGELRWAFRAQSVVSTAPLISGEVVYFGALDQKYYCLNLEDGRELWNFTTRGRIRTSPVAWGEYLLGASEDKYLYAFTSPENIAAQSN
ncbi:MAG: PQQ-binding-like beta-propeller repeat protein [bacterium]